jgi:brefeldin A-resistance guanine nucleotide exchange factor 1
VKGPCTNCLRKLPEESLEALVEALLSEIPEDQNGSPVLVRVNVDNAPSSPTSGQKVKSGPIYDPSMVYILEFCTILALRDENTVELLGQRVVGVLQALLRDVGNYHPTLVARATFYLFRLLQAGYVSPPWFAGILTSHLLCEIGS